jgi:Na+/H+-translocating membrane pyrophosphatase
MWHYPLVIALTMFLAAYLSRSLVSLMREAGIKLKTIRIVAVVLAPTLTLLSFWFDRNGKSTSPNYSASVNAAEISVFISAILGVFAMVSAWCITEHRMSKRHRQ